MRESLALRTCPPHALGLRIYLEKLAAKDEWPPRWLPAGEIEQPVGKGPNGRGYCRWCWAEVPKGLRAWCSKECSADFNTRISGSWLLHAVYQRDGGVCSRCGADAALAAALIRRLSSVDQFGYRQHSRDKAVAAGARRLLDASHDAARLIAEAWGRDRWSADMNLWEADHIVPVWAGGGCTGPENYRTLCRPCHVIVTAEQAAERAAARRSQQPIAFEAQPAQGGEGA